MALDKLSRRRVVSVGEATANRQASSHLTSEVTMYALTHTSKFHTDWTDEGPQVVERVTVGDRAYDIPYESYAGGDAQVDDYMRSSYESYADAIEREYTLNDVANEQIVDQPETAYVAPTFPVLVGTTFAYRPDAVRATCSKHGGTEIVDGKARRVNCDWTLYWHAPLTQEWFVGAVMAHSYAHSRDARSK